MKRVLSSLFSVLLLFSMTVYAQPEITWEQYRAIPIRNGWDGSFVTFEEIAVKIWIPAQYHGVELVDEDIAEGYIGYYMTKDERSAVSVIYVDAEGMDLEEYAARLRDFGVEEIHKDTVNGFECIRYVYTENGFFCEAFLSENGYIFELGAASCFDEEYSEMIECILASVQVDQ